MSVIVGTSFPGAVNTLRKKTSDRIQVVLVAYEDHDNPYKDNQSCHAICSTLTIAQKIKRSVRGASDAVSCQGFPCLYIEATVSDACAVISKLL